MLFSVLLACILYAFTVHAADKIRVGCVDIGSFMQIDTDGCVTAYGAEYLNMIAAYTGWEYEYVKAPRNQCLDMLRKGKLDLLFPAEYSGEFAGDFLYSNDECSMDVASLVGRKADSRFYYDDDKGFQEIRVGIIKGNDFSGLLEDYSRLHGFSYVPVYYETGAEMKEALNQKKVDAMLSASISYSMNQKLLRRKARTDALTGLYNKAASEALCRTFMETLL